MVADHVHRPTAPGAQLGLDPGDVLVQGALEPGVMIDSVRVIRRPDEVEVQPVYSAAVPQDDVVDLLAIGPTRCVARSYQTEANVEKPSASRGPHPAGREDAAVNLGPVGVPGEFEAQCPR